MASQYIRYIEIIIYCLLTAALLLALYYVYNTTNNIIPTKNLSRHRNNFVNSVPQKTMADNILDYINSAKKIADFKTLNIDTAYLTEDEKRAIIECKNINNDDNTVKTITNLPALFPYTAAKYVQPSSNISCSAIYSEFLLNNKDFDAKILLIPNNVKKSLNDLCPVTVKTPKYINCLDTVDNILKKTSAIVSDVRGHIDDSVNKNIDDSFNKLGDLESDLLTAQMQQKYEDYMLYSGDTPDIYNTSNISDANILAGVNKYYSTKAIEGFSNMDDVIEKGITVMNEGQTKYFSGNFVLTKSFNLLDNITIEIKNNIIIFYDNVSKTPLFFYEYDNVKTVGVLNNNMSVSRISSGELQAVKVRITKLTQNNSGNSMENVELLTLLNNIGFTAPGFIYIVRTDIDVLDGSKRMKKEYYLVKNSGYATMFQMFRAV